MQFRKQAMSVVESSCQYCAQHEPHPLFVYLIRDKRSPMTTLQDINKTDAYIGTSRLPLHRLESHNRNKAFRTGAKSSRGIAPYWQVEFILGPFTTGASSCKQRWRSSSRKLSRRIKFGVQLAQELKVPIWYRDEQSYQLANRLVQGK